MRPITKLTMFAFAASAIAAPAFAADMFLKLGPVTGESTDRVNSSVPPAASAQIEIMSFSWGASQMSHAGSGGMGAGKVSMQDMSVMRGPRQTTAMDGVQVAAGEESATAGAGKVSMQDMSVTTSVASPGDAASPRDSASGMPTGKRQHGSVTITKPLDRGSVTVTGNLPGCTVGAAYADAVLQTAAMRYELKEVLISGCAAAGPGGGGGGGATTASVTLDYASYRGSPIRQ